MPPSRNTRILKDINPFHSNAFSILFYHPLSAGQSYQLSSKFFIFKLLFHILITKMSSQTAVIISGFACIGKSQLGRSGTYKGYQVVDLDSSGFTADPKTKVKRSIPDFVKAYITEILKYAKKKVILLVSTHQESMFPPSIHYNPPKIILLVFEL